MEIICIFQNLWWNFFVSNVDNFTHTGVKTFLFGCCISWYCWKYLFILWWKKLYLSITLDALKLPDDNGNIFADYYGFIFIILKTETHFLCWRFFLSCVVSPLMNCIACFLHKSKTLYLEKRKEKLEYFKFNSNYYKL